MTNLKHTRTVAAQLFAAALLLASANRVLAAVRYVDVNSTNATPPYTNWATAATNIQDAVDAAVAGDEISVTNGIYGHVIVGTSLTLRSVNGPQSTTIDGGGSNRCVYLTNGASLSGFTLTAGSADVGSGAYGGTLTNCALTGNFAFSVDPSSYGGGAAYSTLNNCMLAGNSAEDGDGGGAYYCTLNNCTLTENSAHNGGGAYNSTLNNCTLSDNSAGFGGGAFLGTLNRCILTGNSAFGGGGAAGSTLNNCMLSGNMAEVGGGTFRSSGLPLVIPAKLNNCTLTGNSATTRGGGAAYSTPNNCIVYFNTAPQEANYDSSCTLNYSCTTPLPTNGVGNITNEPAFVNPAAGNYRLRPDSPCIDAGTNLSASITNDLDGRPRPLDGNGDGLAAFDMGAYEYRTPLLVWQDSPNPTPPHADWSTAAHTIQDAVDVAVAGDEIVVTNGIYATGGRSLISYPFGNNRVVVDKPLSIRSVNGPLFTIIDGGRSGRCLYLTDNARLSGFTVTNGLADYSGGLRCESTNAAVSNCVVSGNLAHAAGGGAYGGTLNNCTLSGNSVELGVGGAYKCTLNNCTLTGNSSFFGGSLAVEACTLNNCIVLGGSYDSSLNYCWTTAPLFVDQAAGDLRLQSNSPCINAGLNAFAPAGPDLDGNPRIVGGTVDMGAYEFQSLSLISLGVVANQFGFHITGQSNWVIVLEASSDFTNWTPLTTNKLSGSAFPFRDLTPPNLPQHFYRARLQ